jgi:hypothetical protein
MASEPASGRPKPKFLAIKASWDGAAPQAQLASGAPFPERAKVRATLDLGATSARARRTVNLGLCLKLERGRPEVTKLDIEAERLPLTANVVHELPLGWVIDQLLTAVATAVERHPETRAAPTRRPVGEPPAAGWLSVELAPQDVLGGPSILVSRRGRPVSDETLREVAAIVNSGRLGARSELTRKFDVSEATIDRWIAKARELG